MFGDLPAGVSLSPGGVLTGSPTAEAAEFDETGLYTIMIQVSDSHTGRVTGAAAPRTATKAITQRVRLSYHLNIWADRPDGPALGTSCFGCHGPSFKPDVLSGMAASLIIDTCVGPIWPVARREEGALPIANQQF
jgi:hypothetical protein